MARQTIQGAIDHYLANGADSSPSTLAGSGAIAQAMSLIGSVSQNPSRLTAKGKLMGAIFDYGSSVVQSIGALQRV